MNNINLENQKLVWTTIIFVSVGLIIGMSCIILFEILDAKQNCENIEGEYNFDFLKGHFCNDKTFSKYKKCFAGECEFSWGFENPYEINVSEFLHTKNYIRFKNIS